MPELTLKSLYSFFSLPYKRKWFILNASPDLRQQLWQNPELMPIESDPLRYSPIMGVVLTNADVDHTAGLINLRDII